MSTASAVVVLLAGLYGAAAAEAAPATESAKGACQPVRAARNGTQGTAQALQIDADGGNVEAMNALGVMYAQGLGIARSGCMAKRMFERAAWQGYAPAMANLGAMHALGEPTARDAERAYAWLRAALYVGVPDLERDATVFKLGMVAGRLDVRQVRRAEALARQVARSTVARRGGADVRPPTEAAPSRELRAS